MLLKCSQARGPVKEELLNLLVRLLSLLLMSAVTVVGIELVLTREEI